MKYLLDTNIISELISKQPNQKVLDFIMSLAEDNTYLSVATIGEIKSGIENVKSIDRKEKLSMWFKSGDICVLIYHRLNKSIWRTPEVKQMLAI